MTVLVLLTLLAQASAGADQQGTAAQLSGIVRDESSPAPLAGVKVTLTGPSGSKQTTTNTAGEYAFAGLLPGEYSARFYKGGILDVTVAVVVQAGETRQLNLPLTVSERVVVSAGRRDESLQGASAAVSVIDSHMIENLPGSQVTELLSAVPGANITQFSARDVEVNTRGATGVLANSMLVMVDGRSIVQPFYGAVYWDLITVNNDEIDQIEVVRTPASALWGPSAMNGVVNIRTRPLRKIRGLRGTFGLGEWGTRQASVTWVDTTTSFSYKLSGSYYEQDAWERDNLLPDGSPMPPQATFENKGTRQPKFDARIDFDADPERVWSVRGALASTSGLTHSGLGPGEFADGSYYSYAEVEHRRPTLDAKVYWNRLHSPYKIVLFNLDEEATADTFVGEFTKRLTTAKHQVSFGAGFHLDRFDVSIAPDDDSRVDVGAFVEDRFTISRVVTLIAGARVDKFDTTPAVLAPRIGATISPHQGQTFRVTYNRANRAPSLLENFVNVSLPSAVPIDPPFYYTQQVVGSTDLEMEKLDAIELGYTGAIGSNAVVFATVYDQRVDSKIWFLPVSFYGPGAPPPGWPYGDQTVPILVDTFSFVNLGSVRNRGIELATRFDTRRLSLQGAYTFQALPELDGAGAQLPINQPSRHQAGGSAIFSSEGWTAAGSVYYTGSAFWADVLTEPFWGTTPSFVAVNSSVSYRFSNQPWELRVDATNLLDETIKRHVYGDIIRRKVTVGLRWRWDRPL